MKGLFSSLRRSLKRPKEEHAESSVDHEDSGSGDLVAPHSGGESSDDEYTSRPKRRSVSIDLVPNYMALSVQAGGVSAGRSGSIDCRSSAPDPRPSLDRRRASIDRRPLATCIEGVQSVAPLPPPALMPGSGQPSPSGPAGSGDSSWGFAERRASVDRRGSLDRRASLEQWQEARRARNSLDGQATISTDKLTVCKAGQTLVVNKTYITVKHLGSGTFGRVMLCFNVYDQRLYAIKACRKSQFAQNVSRYNHTSRLRRNSQLQFSSVPSVSNGLSSFGSGAGGGHGGGAFASGGASAHPSAVNGAFGFNAVRGGSFGAGVNGSLASSGTTSSGAANGAGSMCTGAGMATASSSGLLAGPRQGSFTGQHGPFASTVGEPHGDGGAAAAVVHGSAGMHAGGGPGLPPLAAAGGACNGLSSSGIPSAGGGGAAFGSAAHHELMRCQTEELVREIAILKKLSHPNIVNLLEVIDDPTTDSLLLVMEYVEGGTLEPRELAAGQWATVVEADVWKYVREVLQGMDYLHANRVVHGDLKPANLLLDATSGRVKIADFGSSIMAGSEKCFMRSTPGFSTPAFRSPESLTSGYQPSFEMDMWALGVCVYLWVYGRLPFAGAAPFIIYDKIRSQDVQLPDGGVISHDLRDFMVQLLEKDVLKRLDVSQALRHPWVTRGGTAPLRSLHDAGPSLSGCSTGACDSLPPSRRTLSHGPGVWGGVDVSVEDMEGAIRQIDGGLAQVMDWVFEEVHYEDGEYLVTAGDSADRIFLVARGEVEILADSPACGGDGAGGGCGGVSGSLIQGLTGMDSGDLELFDARISDAAHSPRARASVRLVGRVMDLASAGCSSSSSCADAAAGRRLLAVKGPGESLGLPCVSRNSFGCSFDGPGGLAPPSSALGGRPMGADVCAKLASLRWACCVRARGQVAVFTARASELFQLVDAHPEMESAVQQIVTQQETDMLVAEAMRQLRLISDPDTPAQGVAAGVAPPPRSTVAASS